MLGMDQIEETLATARRLRRYGGNVHDIEAARFTRQMRQLRATLTAAQYSAFLLRLRLQIARRIRGEDVDAGGGCDQAQADGDGEQLGIEAV